MKQLKELFLPSEFALKFKELGFNEPCLRWYDKDGDLVDIFHGLLLAPLYQQAVDFFREKYDINVHFIGKLNGVYTFVNSYPVDLINVDTEHTINPLDAF